MARPRNNIAKMPSRIRVRIARLDVNGVGPTKIAATIAAEHPDLPRIHASSVVAYRRGAEYAEIRDRILFEDQRNSKLEQIWGAVEQQGMDAALQSTLYMLMHQAFDAAGGKLEIEELTKLVNSLAGAQRAEIAKTADARKQQVAKLKAEHAAEIFDMTAEHQTEITRLLARIGELEGSAERAGGGLSDEALEEIEQKAKLL